MEIGAQLNEVDINLDMSEITAHENRPLLPFQS